MGGRKTLITGTKYRPGGSDRPGRQIYDKLASPACLADQFDIPLVQFDKGFHQVKAYAVTFFLRAGVQPGLAVKAEYVILLFGWYANACVLYRDEHTPVGRVCRHNDRSSGVVN